jgi:hypothetical protein
MKILLAVDGSKPSMDSVKLLIDHADWYREKPEVELLTVHLPLPKLGGMSAVVGKKQIDDYYREEGEKCLVEAKKALERAGLNLKDMDVIEINEAFASQVLGCLRIMNVDFKDPRVNPNGGAIAIGHPLGASGARLALTAMRQLEQIDGRYALVTMCIGVGQGIAAVIERVKQ